MNVWTAAAGRTFPAPARGLRPTTRGGLTTARDSDDALAARAGRGDRLAASALIVRHADRVYALCRRMLRDRAAAEDAAQETFLKLWTHAGRWRPGRAQFGTWLCRVAINACLDRLRREGREVDEDAAPERADDAPHAEDLLIAGERRAAVEAAVSLLPDRQRMALALTLDHELSDVEAASAMKISVEALESLLARARRSLRARLAPQPAPAADATEGAGHE